MGAVGSALGIGGGDSGKKDIRKAADTQAAAQREALAYLKEREQIPQQFREEALNQLAGAYGVPGGAGAEEFLRNAESSPVYQAIMGNIPQQEESILRNQSATGALRTGASDAMLAENQRKTKSGALMSTLQGVQGMAQLPSLAPQIASGIAGVGQTLAQGQIAAAQYGQSQGQNQFGNMLGLGQLGIAGYEAFSDPRLKANPVKIAVIDGIQIFEWDWNQEAEKLGLTGKGQGPMADEIKRFWPERVTRKSGYLYIKRAA